MRNSQIRCIAVAALFAAVAPAISVAGNFSWFDDTQPASFGAGAWTSKYAAFSFDLYRPVESAAESTPDDTRDNDTMRLFGGMEHDPLPQGGPFRLTETRETTFASRRLRTLGLAWQHRLEGMNHFTVAASVGGGTPLFTTAPDLIDTRATVSLTSRWQAAYRPRVTGSVFVGGESALPETYRTLGRRYYGLAIGSELTLSRAHTPYVSFQMQRSLSASDDALAASALDDDRAQIAAGWKWQAKPYLSLRAEASVGYNGNRLRLQNPERTRVFFGTRFDFQ